MTLYKVLKNNRSCHGGDFDWTDYLPKGKKKGKWTPAIKKLNECHTGWHVTPYGNMWCCDGCDVFECECKGLVEKPNTVGVVDKFVCKSVRLIAKIDVVTDGYWNTGEWNIGYWNTGDRNTGNRNTGDRNTGDRNTGDWNTGDRNIGYWNTGDRNLGYWNTGDWNLGYRNTGYWNLGNRHVGCFNSNQPQYIELFNKPISRLEFDNIRFPSWLHHEGDWSRALRGASKQGVVDTIALPNFDYAVFEEITGITREMLEEKL